MQHAGKYVLIPLTLFGGEFHICSDAGITLWPVAASLYTVQYVMLVYCYLVVMKPI